jgi:DNA-binding winged helix-turn-helix (wHTH) protein/TolB-like protein/Flp pilus assembly protein TadD
VHSGQGYTFGPFRLDPTEGRLTRNGEPVRVPPNALALLTVLVTRAGFLVTNEELIADAWPNTPAAGDQLAAAIATLRTALDDERGEQYIETVPRTGYRFVAPVVQSRLDTVWFDTSAEAVSGERARWSMAWAAAGILVLIVAIGAALLWSTPPGSGAPAGGVVSSLVVIPFQTAGASGDQNYLGLGMADALAMRLSRVEQLRVPPTAAVQAREDAFDAGRRLAVDAVLTGSIQRDGDRVRVTAQLSQVGDRHQIWTARFDDRFTDIFAVQDAIAERIVSSLLRNVDAGQRAALHRRETENVEAYDRYLRGREQWSRRTIESTRAAIQSYQDAIALDPGFAAAYAGLADAYTGNASGLPPDERFPLAHAAVDRALAINPDLADAQVALGYLRYRADWDFAGAERALDRAIVLDPRNNLAHHHLGQVHKILGEWPESLAEFRRAHELNPHHPRTHADLAIVLLFMGRVPEARAIVEDGVKHAGDNAELHEELADVLAAEGHADEALEAHLKARLMSGSSFEEIDLLRQAYRAGGRPGELRKENALLIASLPGDLSGMLRGVATALADNFAQLHDRDETIHWLGQSFDRREEGPLGLNYPEFDFVRADPRFDALHQRVFGAAPAPRKPGPAARASLNNKTSGYKPAG